MASKSTNAVRPSPFQYHLIYEWLQANHGLIADSTDQELATTLKEKLGFDVKMATVSGARRDLGFVKEGGRKKLSEEMGLALSEIRNLVNAMAKDVVAMADEIGVKREHLSDATRQAAGVNRANGGAQH